MIFTQPIGICMISTVPNPQVKRLNITVDILVNSAGVCRVGQFDTLEEEDLNAQMQLNVVGTTLISRLFAKGK